jgi:hypothetical protein
LRFAALAAWIGVRGSLAAEHACSAEALLAGASQLRSLDRDGFEPRCRGGGVLEGCEAIRGADEERFKPVSMRKPSGHDLESIRRQLDLERRTLAPEGCILETLPHVSRLRCPDRGQHMIVFSSLTEDIADVTISEQAAHYRTLATEVEWKVYQHDSPSDLLQRLERHGFEAGLRETVLVLELQKHAGWIEAQSAYQVIRIEDAHKVGLYRRAAEDIFERDHESTATELLSGIRRCSTQHLGYVVTEGNTAVGIGRLYSHPQSAFGGMYGGGTLKQYRGRGVYRATVAARAREAIKFGARYLLVDALPTSRPILEKLGFVRLTDTWPCTLKP